MDVARAAALQSYCGHGIGALFHTVPNVPHYSKNKAVLSSAGLRLSASSRTRPSLPKTDRVCCSASLQPWRSVPTWNERAAGWAQFAVTDHKAPSDIPYPISLTYVHLMVPQVGVMKPGHVFTIEPMINASGSGQDVTWPDNWTAVRAKAV